MPRQILDDLNLEKRSSSKFKFKFKFKFKWNPTTQRLLIWISYILLSVIIVEWNTYNTPTFDDSAAVSILLSIVYINYMLMAAVILIRKTEKSFATLNIGMHLYIGLLLMVVIWGLGDSLGKIATRQGWHPQVVCLLLWVLPTLILSEWLYFLAKELGLLKK